jgi:Xaa-Pro aminopeptidase
MASANIDAWLVYDFRGNSPVLPLLLPPPPPPAKRWTTRRVWLFIPGKGTPRLLVHHIDAAQFEGTHAPPGVALDKYLTWQEMHAWLARHVGGRRVAMEYAPGNALPVVSVTDAGTVELVRALGAEVASSADLVQVFAARWPAESVKVHAEVSCLVTGIKDAAFAMIRDRVAAKGEVAEHEVQAMMRDRFTQAGLEYLDGPIVARGPHSGDPHFEPTPDNPTPIRKGDWVLIDLWARMPGRHNIFSDITWVGFVGSKVPDEHQRVFDAVKAARDAALNLAQTAWRAGESVQGWQLDDAARSEIVSRGYSDFIRHRTGHSLSPGLLVHGLGMNLDNLETHDTRRMLPGTGFTIEPGIYTPAFGCRLEINVYADPKKGPTVTSCVQDEPVLLA